MHPLARLAGPDGDATGTYLLYVYNLGVEWRQDGAVDRIHIIL